MYLDLINYKAACRTLLATPGLLNICQVSAPKFSHKIALIDKARQLICERLAVWQGISLLNIHQFRFRCGALNSV